jgi:hypothetical protein
VLVSLFLDQLTATLDATPHEVRVRNDDVRCHCSHRVQLNCNMPAVNYVIHRSFGLLTFAGWPFTR